MHIVAASMEMRPSNQYDMVFDWWHFEMSDFIDVQPHKRANGIMVLWSTFRSSCVTGLLHDFDGQSAKEASISQSFCRHRWRLLQQDRDELTDPYLITQSCAGAETAAWLSCQDHLGRLLGCGACLAFLSEASGSSHGPVHRPR